MPTYKKAPPEVVAIANEILCSKQRHRPLLDFKAKIDILMAYGERDERGEKVGDAIKHHGLRALGLARKIGLRERAAGLGDCQVLLDGDWWESEANELMQRAVLDHELTHFEVKIDKRGVVRDDLGRPKILLRPHDFEFGWFNCIALEYGIESQEHEQAARIAVDAGQCYWPDIFGEAPAARGSSVTIKTGGKSVTISSAGIQSAAQRLKKHVQGSEEPPLSGTE